MTDDDGLRSVSWADMMKVEPPPAVQLVEGLVWQGLRPFSLWGPGGISKSLVAMYMGVCLRLGRPFLGLETTQVDWFGYVDGDDGDAAVFARRLRRLTAGMGLDAVPDRMGYLAVDFNIDTPEGTKRIEREMKAWAQPRGHGVVIFDAVGSLFSGDMNAAEVATRAFLLPKRWGSTYKFTPGLIDHVGWKGSHEIASSSKRWRVGSSLELRPQAFISETLARVGVFIPKANQVVTSANKWAPPVREYEVTFVDPDGPITFTVIEGHGPVTLGDRIVAFLESVAPVRASTAEVAVAVGTTPKAVLNAISRHCVGRVESDGHKPAAWGLRTGG